MGHLGVLRIKGIHMKYKLCLPVSFGSVFLKRESQSKEQQKQFCITWRISIFVWSAL